MARVIIIALLFCGCYSPRWVAQPAKVTTMGKKISIKLVGKARNIGDTTIDCMLIRKQ